MKLRSRHLAALVLFGGAILLGVFLYFQHPGDSKLAKPVAVSPPKSALGTASTPALIGNGSPLAAKINAPDQPPAADLKILHSLVKSYIVSLQNRQGPPIGDNIDLVRALNGRNPLHLVFLPRDHPAIDSRGQLLDRWATPYFIHPLSSRNYEIRSAGPDKKLFTTDDLLINPPPPPPK